MEDKNKRVFLVNVSNLPLPRIIPRLFNNRKYFFHAYFQLKTSFPLLRVYPPSILARLNLRDEQ